MSATANGAAAEVERTWTDEHVARGRELVTAGDRCPWELGDLSLEAIPRRDIGGDMEDRREHGRQVRAFAVEIGVEFNTLRTYRKTAFSWPADRRRSAASFEAHKALGGPPSDAPHRAKIMDELAAQSVTGRVTRDEIRKYLSSGSSRKTGVDFALEVLDLLTKAHQALDKAERRQGPQPFPQRKVRDRYAARLADAEQLAARIRAIAEDTR